MTKVKQPRGKASYKPANGAWHALIALDGKIVCVFKAPPTLEQGNAMAESISYTAEDPRDRDIERREHTADCAWFFMRFVGPITSMRQEQVVNLLIALTAKRIESDAAEIQSTFCHAQADLIQTVLVGDPVL